MNSYPNAKEVTTPLYKTQVFFYYWISLFAVFFVLTVIRQVFIPPLGLSFTIVWCTTTYTRIALIVMLWPLFFRLPPIIRIIYTTHKHSNLLLKSINKWSFPITIYLLFSLLIMAIDKLFLINVFILVYKSICYCSNAFLQIVVYTLTYINLTLQILHSCKPLTIFVK